jgi:signal transduction histidine kinase
VVTSAPLVGPQLDFQRLFESSPDVLLVLRPDAPRFTMVAATDSRLAATHTTRAQILGTGLFELFPDNPDDPTASGARNLRASLERVLATRGPDTMAVQKYDIRRPDGTFETRYWSPRNLPVLSPSGELLYILHRVEDVTELVRASELGEELRGRTSEMEHEVVRRSRELADALSELREANRRLGELDEAKSAFYANASHELRTPLTLLLGPISDALADVEEPLGPRQRARIELANSGTGRLLRLVNSLLDLSRLESGRMRSRFGPTDLPALTAELAAMYVSAAERGGIEFVIDCPSASRFAWVDRDHWEKIVPNLVSNAFQHTRSGRIQVRLRELQSEFELEVSDTGAGIAEVDLPRIFDRFYRAPAAFAGFQEGTGIGLALVRELVELHGGRISVESEPGVGSTFRVEIPAGFSHLPPEAVSAVPLERGGLGVDSATRAAEAERLAMTRESQTVSGPEVATPRSTLLLVEDNPDLRIYLTSLLSPLYELIVAPEGESALAAISARVPDLVVSDVMMPRLDGLGLVRRIRSDPRTATLPVILLSARAGEGAALGGIESGADDYVVKPFSARELLTRVRAHLELARIRREALDAVERANRELAAFSYSVSHDLRAPLRSIDGYRQLLAEALGDELAPDPRRHLERIGEGIQRMSGMIDALLELARLSRVAVRHEEVDLSELASEVIGELRRSEPTRRVAVEIEAGLRAAGDRRLLRIVLANLLGNSWKFTSQTERASILFGRDPNDAAIFMVRDNGAGFDMTYAHKLFAPFERLHSQNEFGGTGIGLATVSRILDRHGGWIRAEGETGRGATLRFTLAAGDS